ncbi:hypothetical protein [Paenibacillus sp. FSL H7-0331]|nr:hypothetical protein [Paenibacillus sp. FSL H7-0331]
MRKIRTGFTETEIKLLESNPNVSRVSGRNISYAPAFKLAAVQANTAGEPPMEIFLKAGFSIELVGQRTPTESLYRWRETYAKYGEAGLLEERRGLGSTGRRSKTESSAEEKLQQAEARIKLLEAENELLKKLEALER